MALLSVILGLSIFAVPPAAAVGLGLWTRRLRNRTALPRYAGWTGYVFVALVGTVTIGTFLGLVQSFIAIRAPGITATDRQRILASAIAEAMYNSAFGIPFAVVGALWLGFFTWRRAPRRACQ